jgi:hypothetical protein
MVGENIFLMKSQKELHVKKKYFSELKLNQ